MLLSKDDSKGTTWQKGGVGSHVEILKDLWDWAKDLQLKRKELRNELLLSKDKFNETA